jgi:hypothetical protein
MKNDARIRVLAPFRRKSRRGTRIASEAAGTPTMVPRCVGLPIAPSALFLVLAIASIAGMMWSGAFGGSNRAAEMGQRLARITETTDPAMMSS